LSNTRNDLKGRCGKKPYPGHEEWIRCPYDKGQHEKFGNSV